MKRLATLILFFVPAIALATEPSWDLYAEILGRHVAPGEQDGVRLNLVDYDEVARDPGFAALVNQVRGFDVRSLESREEKLAFYINAYNILTIQLIVDHWPLESIRDIGNFFRGPWDIVMLENADGELTLDDIEHEIIRSLGEPRIHFAVNCASVSCPDLRAEPYTASRLDEQLEEQTRDFLANPGKGVTVEGNDLRVSKLFDWYEEDFGDIAGFVREHKQGIEFKRIDGYLDYNWSLNDNSLISK
jgi:hypothetical protein